MKTTKTPKTDVIGSNAKPTTAEKKLIAKLNKATGNTKKK